MNQKKRNERSYGAISVFLAIILVPCMVFTCVFGDLSRVQLSMATSQSAADLALYSLLARYDEDLKEYYGLVASCQDIEEFYDVTETYFEGMLKAEGVSGEGSDLFVSYLHDLENNGYSDFLRTDIVDEIQVGETANSSLGQNPALIEDSIVEFMKYRGPIQLTTKLIDRFTQLDFASQISDADDNKQVSDKKQEYAEQQGELLKMAFYTYRAIREYEKLRASCGLPDSGKYKDLAQKLGDIRNDLKGATVIITQYYFPGTESLQRLNFPYFQTADYVTDKETVGKEVDIDGTLHYCIDKALLDELLEGLDDDLKAITDAGTAFVNATSGIPAPGGGNNEVVYCMKMQQAISSSGVTGTISSKGDDVMKTYGKLQAAAECEPMPENSDLPADWQQQIQDACDKIDEVYDDYLNANSSSAYWTKAKEYGTTADRVVSKVQGRQYTFTSKLTGGNTTVGDFAAAVSNYLRPIRDDLTKQIEKLNVAIDGGTLPDGKTASSLDSLLQKAQEFTNARNDWGNTAAAYDTDYAKSEYQLFQGAQAAASGGGSDDKEVEGEKIAAQITQASVTELKNRLVNIRNDMQACLDAMDAATYGGVKLADLSNGETLISAARTVVPQTTDISMDAAKNAAYGYFDSLMKPASGDVYKAPDPNNAADGNEPDLDKQTPKLYRFLKDKLQENENNVDQEIENNDKKNQEYKDKAEAEKNSAQSADDSYITGKGKDLTDVSGGDAVDLLDSLGSVVTIADNVINGSGDELRDQLYVCEYIMDMFSYATLNNEGKYRLELDSNANVTFQDFPYSNQQALWDADDPRSVMENQSLTNRQLNAANNHAFLGEVEYILYGNASLNENLKASYANIFAIREMLNIVSGFCNFYNNAAITSAAALVATATAGIVPVPVTKCVLILVLATLESAKDLNRLKAGGRVELYKMRAEDWFYYLDEGDAFPPGDGMANAPENGLYYSDYMYIFLLLGLTNGDRYPDMLLRVGDLIQANMRLATGQEGYSLDKARCYFSLTGTLRVRPLMMTLPIVNTVDGSTGLRENTDWCTYKVNLVRGYS